MRSWYSFDIYSSGGICIRNDDDRNLSIIHPMFTLLVEEAVQYFLKIESTFVIGLCSDENSTPLELCATSCLVEIAT